MKFIFPQNYSFKNKLFGFIDYSTLFLNIIWDFFMFCFLDLFNLNISIKISIFIIFCKLKNQRVQSQLMEDREVVKLFLFVKQNWLSMR